MAKLLTLMPENKDYIVIIKVTGEKWKGLMIDRFKMERNSEISELKRLLSLEECMDYRVKPRYYLDLDNFFRLRYGAVIIMTDNHNSIIIPFLMNYFHYYFPSLLTRNYVMYSRYPIVRATKNSELQLFIINKNIMNGKIVMMTIGNTNIMRMPNLL